MSRRRSFPSFYNEFKIRSTVQKEWYLVCPISQMALISGPVFSPNGETQIFLKYLFTNVFYIKVRVNTLYIGSSQVSPHRFFFLSDV